MTPIEMAKAIAYFEHSGTLVSKDQRDLMKQHRIGMDVAGPANEIHGNYYGKAGSIGTSSDPTVSQGVPHPDGDVPNQWCRLCSCNELPRCYPKQ